MANKDKGKAKAKGKAKKVDIKKDPMARVISRKTPEARKVGGAAARLIRDKLAGRSDGGNGNGGDTADDDWRGDTGK